MVLEQEWPLNLGDNLSLGGGLKGEKPYQRKFRWLGLKV